MLVHAKASANIAAESYLDGNSGAIHLLVLHRKLGLGAEWLRRVFALQRGQEKLPSRRIAYIIPRS